MKESCFSRSSNPPDEERTAENGSLNQMRGFGSPSCCDHNCPSNDFQSLFKWQRSQRRSPSSFGVKSLRSRSEEHTSELQSRQYLVCRLLLEKKKTKTASSVPRT